MPGTAHDWTARWVWLPDDARGANSHTYFRTEFDIGTLAPDDRFLLRISADFRYRLWVNGRHLDDGPPPSGARLRYYDTHDLTRQLRTGRNCLAVDVRYVGPLGAQFDTSPPGFLAECVGPAGVVAATGTGPWRCRLADAWSTDTFKAGFNIFDPYQEIFDARHEPAGWRAAGYDDTGWRKPVRLPAGSTDPAGLLARPIPPMRTQARRPAAVVGVEECLALANRTDQDLSIGLSQAGRPLRTARVDHADRFVSGAGPVTLACSDRHLHDHAADGQHDPCVLLDLGREETAYVELDVDGPAGAVVDVGLAERLVDGRFTNAIEGQFAVRYVLPGGRTRWRSYAWRGVRYLRVRIGNATEPVHLHDLSARVTGYPFTDRGHFDSSDSRLAGIVDMCRHTIRLCCHESIMDTPWREQAQWLGDIAAVTLDGIYACFGDTMLAEKFFRQAAATQCAAGTLANVSNVTVADTVRPDADMPDYSLWWVIGLLGHYRYSGDRGLVADLYDVVRRLLDGALAHRTERGLLASFGTVLIDWAAIDRDGECAAFNAIAVGALRAGTELARLADDQAAVGRWTAAADQMHAVFESAFFDRSRGVLVDAVHADGARSEKVSEHANFAALRFGLLGADTTARIVDHLLVDRDVAATEAQPFFTSVLLDALARVGRTDLALEVIRDRWGTRMLDLGATSCYEEWGVNGSWRAGSYRGFMRTLSHAWSAHPAAFLIRTLPGIQIVEPGCGRLRISPTLDGPDYRVVFPTPHGEVTVEVTDGRASIDAPATITVDTGVRVTGESFA